MGFSAFWMKGLETEVTVLYSFIDLFLINYRASKITKLESRLMATNALVIMRKIITFEEINIDRLLLSGHE